MCLSAPKLCFTVTSAAPDTWAKAANLIGRIVYDAAHQTQKNEPEVFKKNYAFTRGIFRIGVHTHIGSLFLVTRRQTSANIAREIRPGVYGPLVFILRRKCLIVLVKFLSFKSFIVLV